MSSKEFKITVVKKTKKPKLIIEGNLVLNNILQIKNEVAEKIEISNIRSVELKNIIDVDLSIFQLLKSMKKLNANIEYSFNFTEEQRSLIENAGLLEVFS